MIGIRLWLDRIVFELKCNSNSLRLFIISKTKERVRLFKLVLVYLILRLGYLNLNRTLGVITLSFIYLHFYL